jgi:hypothetical protein
MPDIVAAALMISRAQQDGEREAAGEIWQQTKDMPSLIFTGRCGTLIDLRTSTGSSRRAARPFVKSRFMTPGTHVPRCSST